MKQSINIRRRIAELRSSMQAKGIQACIIPSSDAHQSEYVPEYWKTRMYFSGFTGSAGTLVVTGKDACLWTDSRYFLQAEKELEGTDIVLQKEKLPSTLSIEAWLCEQLPEGSYVGIDAHVFNISEVESMKKKMLTAGILLLTDFDPTAQIWTDRPPIPKNPVFLLEETFSGESLTHKVDRLRKKMGQNACNAILLCALDEVAWLFNIRGNDISCNPLTVAYALITPMKSILFIDNQKITDSTSDYFQKNGVELAAYDALPDYLSRTKELLKIRLDSGKTNYYLYDVIRKLSEKGSTIRYFLQSGPSPVALMKAVKNETEVAGFRSAMEKDGVALVQLLMWLEKSLTEKTPLSETNLIETDVAAKIKEFRKRQSLYFGESFDAIVGYMEHGAIVHYHAEEATAGQLRSEGILLVDTGGQYFDGTTDITRTISLGAITPEMKHDFTLVLKGHIAIATARFPENTRGAQLDVLARNHLWQEGLSYMHGTGHGVGHFLNVHEGPQHIRLEENPVCLEPGMVTSNEPGVYRSGKYGIRIENLVLVKKEMETDFGKFYGFETLTLCPIDLQLVQVEILSSEEKAWLNTYHQTVYQRLSPKLSKEEQDWLKRKTSKI
jgi:Xaa-Pro aminopeptidase